MSGISRQGVIHSFYSQNGLSSLVIRGGWSVHVDLFCISTVLYCIVRKSFYSIPQVRLVSFNGIVLSYGKEDGDTLCLFKIAETKMS